MLQLRDMRMFAATALVIFTLLSVGCSVILQPPQQGEWSNFHDKADQNTNDVKPAGEGGEK